MSNLKEFSIKDILNNDQYIIPMYQRNYAWDTEEVSQLIEDIADYVAENKTLNYYLGNLIAFSNKEKVFETVDGQQRLTTLNIIACSLKNQILEDGNNLFSFWEKVNLSFDYREISNKALETIFSYKNSNDSNASESHIWQIFNEVSPIIQKICTNKSISIEAFVDYFLNNVKIIRILLPEDTDLNHYFEIMNSRGEQLEKHEIVKAKLISYLDEDNGKICNLIWDACSNMDNYIQMNFLPQHRTEIFGDTWDSFNCTDSENLFTSLAGKGTNKCDIAEELEESILDILTLSTKTQYKNPQDDIDSKNERFNSVIFFPSFLLHALTTYLGRGHAVTLDDKQLLKHFEKINRDNVKDFTYHLLRLRFLFDQYIIKREFLEKREGWSIKKLKVYEKKTVSYVNSFGNEDEIDNSHKSLIMLQSMFHVSSPAQNYKYWLNGALHFLHTNYKKAISYKQFKDYLFSLAQSYMCDRYMLKDDVYLIDFMTIIYDNNATPQHTVKYVDWNNLNKGTSVENFVFNFYDYILWDENKTKFSDFEFAFRSSIEHFHPQTPIDESDKLSPDLLHSFGNLCIISRGTNSKFSNNMPLAKTANFKNIKNLSLKLRLLMTFTGNISYEQFVQNQSGLAIKKLEKALYSK